MMQPVEDCENMLGRSPRPEELDSYSLAKRLGESMLRHALTEEMFTSSLRRTGYSMCDYVARGVFTRDYSWAVFTREWLWGIRRLTAGKRVLEVCAGRGCIEAALTHVREADIKPAAWISTDIEPKSAWVRPMRALPAVARFQPDIILASWIPYKSPLDYRLAALGKPMILVGEGQWGCTGTDAFWKRFHDATLSPYEVLPDFDDVPQWSGIHDHTTLVNWSK